MQLNDFTGGINNKQSPFLIASNEAIDLINVDFDNSTLKPIKLPLNLGKTVKNFYFKYQGREFQSNNHRNYVTKLNKLYWSDGINKAKKYNLKDNTEFNLGISKPKIKPMVTIINNDVNELNGSNSPVVSLEVEVVNLYPIENYKLTEITGDFPAGEYEYLVVNFYGKSNSFALKKTLTVSDTSGIKISDLDGIIGEAKIFRFYNGVYRLIGSVLNSKDEISDTILDISENEEFIDNVEFSNNVEYTHKAIFKDTNNNYGYKIINTITDGIGRIAGFKITSSSDNIDDEFIGNFRLYGRKYLKVGDDKDIQYDLSNNEVAPSIEQLTGVYQYAYTYYNSKDGTESQPSEYSIERHLTNKGILITNIIKSDDPQVDKIRLYRLGGTLTQWHLVQELDNKTQNFIDNYSDYVLSDTLLDSFNNLPPVVGIKQLTYVHGYYIGFKDDKVWWSQFGNPNYWSPFNYIEFEDEVTGIGILPTGILVFLRNKTYIIQGTDPSVFVKFLISSTQGCIDYKSINYVNEKIIWLSNDGFCTSNGGEVIVISQPKLRKLENLNIINSAVVDSIYYLVLDTHILALDFRHSGFKIFKYDMNIKSLSYDSYEDKFYGVDKNNNLVEIFKSSDYTEFEYQSPYFSLTSISNVKLFNDIYIAFSGNIQVDVYIDGVFINSKEFEGGNFAQVKKLVTQTKQRGNYIQLIIRGTGKVYEIEFKAVGRQNGK